MPKTDRELNFLLFGLIVGTVISAIAIKIFG